jgi:protein TonB
MRVVVGADGQIDEARIAKSIPALDKAALAAVTQWRYEPTYKDGVAIPVRMTVTISFASQP